jgi:DNA polymerase IV
MIRKIIHIDMDAFYASIEQRDNPSLRGRPVIVGGSPESRGVVAAASYEARKFGVRSAMPVKRAIFLCKNLVIVRPDFNKYSSVSRQLYTIYKEYTDLIEPIALDEAYLDVTENKKNIATATDIAIELKKRIKSELNLTASAGVAPNKLLAKIASEEKKPDGLFVIKPHQVEHYVKNLDLKKIWGVGKVTLGKLHSMKMFTCSDVQKYSIDDLANLFGKFGRMLFYFARGIDDRLVVSHREAKSIGAETTFPQDLLDVDIIKNALRKQVEIICRRLEQKTLRAKTVTLKIKYFDFTQITRSFTCDHFISDMEEIFGIADKLLMEKTDAGNRKIRLVGASLSGFEENGKTTQVLLIE